MSHRDLHRTLQVHPLTSVSPALTCHSPPLWPCVSAEHCAALSVYLVAAECGIYLFNYPHLNVDKINPFPLAGRCTLGTQILLQGGRENFTGVCVTHKNLTPLKFPSSEEDSMGFVFLLSDQDIDLPHSDSVKSWELAHPWVNLFLEQRRFIWFVVTVKAIHK